ncbi:hypothetical protein GOV09_03870 [Candidatus Woesearchaeota archaeon]|nr:hypothetical protein [Candidatus Woesearchaeota archaeon]
MVDAKDIFEYCVEQFEAVIENYNSAPESNLGRVDAYLTVIKKFGEQIDKEKLSHLKNKYSKYFMD